MKYRENNGKVLMVNMVASLFTLVVNALINLLVMPYIVNCVGAEAYGYVSLANNIVNYATIITIALNSVSSRFIAIEVHRGNINKANMYLNSVLWADIFLCGVVMIFGILFTINIDRFLNIAPTMLDDVRRLFFWLMVNLCLSVVGTVFTVATYITNTLYLSSLANSVAIMLKAITMLLLFKALPASIEIVGVGAVVNSFLILVFNFGFAKKLIPELSLGIRYFSLHSMKDMLSTGIWSSVTKLSATLSDGLDTVITNIYLSAQALGALSVAYTIPSLASQLISAVSNLFNPQLTYYYANNDKAAIVRELKKNMKISGMFACVIFCGIVSMGKKFFVLMVPDENIKLIYHLAVLSCISMVASGITSALNNVFVLTNKLKVNSLVWLFVSIGDVLIVIALVKNTELGVYAVAGVSKIVGAIINLTYLPIYACSCLEINKRTFYPLIARYIVVLVTCQVIFSVVSRLFVNSVSWGGFVVQGIFLGILGAIINFILLLNKEERTYLMGGKHWIKK